MKSRTWLWIGLSIVVLAVVGAGIWYFMRPQADVTACDGVAVYDQPNYGAGPNACLPIGEYRTADLSDADLNDNSISSIKIKPGLMAVLYESGDFTVPAVEITVDHPDLGPAGGSGINNWSNMISSIKVETAPACNVRFYQDVNYAGTNACLEPGSYTLPDLLRKGLAWPNGTSFISSIKVSAGFKVTAYKTSDLSGNSLVFTVDDPNLSDVTDTYYQPWDNRIFSFKVETAPACAVAIYDADNYGGFGTCLVAGNYTAAALLEKGFRNDNMDSIKIYSGFKATVYSNDNFVEPKHEFIVGEPSFSTVNAALGERWHDNVSSIQVMTAMPSELTFTASPTTIVSGGNSKLIWTNAENNCVATGWTFDGSASGTTRVTPTATTTYKLTCGEKEATATVTVGSGECPELTADLARGDCKVNTYDLEVLSDQWTN